MAVQGVGTGAMVSIILPLLSVTLLFESGSGPGSLRTRHGGTEVDCISSEVVKHAGD